MSNITEHVRTLLCNRPRTRTLVMVAKDTGLKVPWLSAFGQGKIRSVDVEKCVKLYEYFTGKKLEY